MDGLQFGRWFSQRRHRHGLASQRALVNAVQRDPLLCEAGITSDFIARLEAGQLAYPFRGKVRRRVLLLARELCTTSTELRGYLQAAGLSSLDSAEACEVEAIRQAISRRDQHLRMPLPRRPTKVFGRERELADLLQALSGRGADLCCITGMPGVGKTTLAFEALYRLSQDEPAQRPIFPDGIAVFTGTGRTGIAGLLALLEDIGLAFGLPGTTRQTSGLNEYPARPESSHRTHDGASFEAEVARAVDRIRSLLSTQRALVVLDDLDPLLPLGPLLDALLSQAPAPSNSEQRGGCVVLTTSRHVPLPRLPAYRFSLGPLSPDAALELFISVIGQPFEPDLTETASMICALVGYLPLALELAGAAVAVRHIPLLLLATSLSAQPLSDTLDGSGELRMRLCRALDDVAESARQRFALLATLGSSPFSLEAAAVLDLEPERVEHHDKWPPPSATMLDDTLGPGNTGAPSPNWAHMAALARTAAELGTLVEHSLVVLADPQTQPPIPGRDRPLWAPPAPPPPQDRQGLVAQRRYALHPLLSAYARERTHTLSGGVRKAAGQRRVNYALSYVERYQDDLEQLDAERGVLLAALGSVADAQQHAQVVTLAKGLRGVVGWRGPDAEGERALLCGAHSAHEVGDRYALVELLTRLGQLHFYRGAFHSARRIWHDALEYSIGLGHQPYTRVALRWCGFLAATYGEVDEARRLASAYVEACSEADEPYPYAGSLVSRAYLHRNRDARDDALADLDTCQTLLSHEGSSQASLATQHLARSTRILELEVSTELARLSGDYARARECSMATLPLLDAVRDRFFVADGLLDQAEFAMEQGERSDAVTLARGALEVATLAGIPHLGDRAEQILAQS